MLYTFLAKNEIFSGDLQQVPNSAVCRGLVVIQILIPGKRKSAGEICTLALRMDGAGTKQRHLQPASEFCTAKVNTKPWGHFNRFAEKYIDDIQMPPTRYPQKTRP